MSRVFLHHRQSADLSELRLEIEDQVQIVFAQLFSDEGRILRAWDPARGLSLRNWVGRFAQLRAVDGVRRGFRGAWRHDATEPAFFEDRSPTTVTPEDARSTAELWLQTKRKVLSGETEVGRQMFELLFEQDLSTKDVMARTKKTEAAIFKW